MILRTPELYIPQRPPIVMLSVVAIDGPAEARSVLCVDRDTMFVNAHGCLSEAGIIENMAQTALVVVGYGVVGGGRSAPPIGYIGEVKSFGCCRQPLVGERLTTAISLGDEFGGVQLVDCRSCIGGEIVAQGVLKICVMDGHVAASGIDYEPSSAPTASQSHASMPLIGSYCAMESMATVGTSATCRLRFIPESDVFRGHFPSRPVCSGACSVELAVECASLLVGRRLRISGLRRCRFTAVATPTSSPVVHMAISATPSADGLAVTAAMTDARRTYMELRATMV